MQSSIQRSEIQNKAKPLVTHPFFEFWNSLKAHRGSLIALALLGFFCVVALFAHWIAPHAPDTQFENALRLPPFWSEGSDPRFLLGTDDVGRDLLSRLIYGARISLGVGFWVALFSGTVGPALGLASGVLGGKVDTIIMRSMDILMSLPSMLLAIVVVTLLGPGLGNAILAVSIVEIPKFVRLARASALAETKKQYVLASQSFGASKFRLIYINILPNCAAPLIVQGALAFSDGILNAAALGFLGLGAQPPTPEWGTMLADARAFIESSPYLVTLPGLCILLLVLAFNLLGDGIRDALDPRLKS